MCEHKVIIGDNYGETCRQCGEQLAGFGYGGFFGKNLTGREVCIHSFQPCGDGSEIKICIYCEEMRKVEKAGDTQ